MSLTLTINLRKNGSAWLCLRESDTQMVIAERTTLVDEDTEKVAAYFRRWEQLSKEKCHADQVDRTVTA